MKKKLLALVLLAGGSAFGATRFSFGVAIGAAPAYYAPAPVVVAPAYPGPDYYWIDGYWGPRHAWVPGYWARRPVVREYYGPRYVERYRYDNRHEFRGR